MKLKRSIVAPVAVAVTALVTGGWFLQKGMGQERNVYFQARLFDEVLHRVSDSFVEQEDPSKLYRFAIDGMLQELGDPHSVFMDPKEYEDLRIKTQGEYGGLGIQIAKRDGWITVVAPLPGTPADRAGMQAGDAIIEVNGESAKGWSEDQAVAKLRGPKGSAADLKVLRPGMDDPIPFHVVREEIHVRSVPAAYMLEPGVGYVNLTVFSESSTDELRQAINRLRGQGMKQLVLDLRYNPGGLLDQGVSIGDLFLTKGQVVSETRSRVAGQSQKYPAVDGDEFPGMPMVVLVNPYTASASEILAGALQDHDRALVLGQTSYGKGSVQTLFPISGGNWLKLTTARWYTPSGRSIQKPYGIGTHDDDGEPIDSVAADSAAKPIYHTDSGRKVLGGGGITPDLIVEPDTFTTAEKAFLQALKQNGSAYTDTRFAYSVAYVHKHPELERRFSVTPQMLEEFYSALAQKGVKVDRAVYNGASTEIAREIGIEIARAKWGEEAVRQRLNAEDPQVRAAVEVLRRAPSPQALFAAAQRYAAANPTVKEATAEQKPPR
ncbi:MAG TPA: S41 family peptidase [Longimicrobiales bacterium]|nr:S41 family peptidase [Longimicrobiales bacterium]